MDQGVHAFVSALGVGIGIGLGLGVAVNHLTAGNDPSTNGLTPQDIETSDARLVREITNPLLPAYGDNNRGGKTAPSSS